MSGGSGIGPSGATTLFRRQFGAASDISSARQSQAATNDRQLELLRIWREAKKTVLFITHQINEAIYLADRVIVFGARPGRVKETIKIDIPRPRELAVKRDPAFLKYEDHLWGLIEEEVKKTMIADQVVHNINN